MSRVRSRSEVERWTSRHARPPRVGGAAPARSPRRLPRHREVAAAEGDGVEQEAVAADRPVDPLRPLLERREGHRPRREPDPRADLADVVEVVVEPLQLEEQGAGAAKGRARPQAGGLLGGLRAGHAVGHRAGAAGVAQHVDELREGAPLGQALEVAVLVEEAGVEMDDALADRVEAEMARLDDARVDGADGDLVDVVSRHGRGPRVETARVVHEGPQGLVAGEVDAVEVVRLALVPGVGQAIDHRRQRGRSGARSATRVAVAEREQRARAPPRRAGREGVREAGAALERPQTGLAPRRRRDRDASLRPRPTSPGSGRARSGPDERRIGQR